MSTKTSELLAGTAPATVAVVRGVADDQLDLPTPCLEFRVRDLLNHLFDVVVNFQTLARREAVDWAAKEDRLTAGWRDRFAVEVERTVEAWSDPAAVEGESAGMGLPQATVGDMLLTDLTVHGWDLARATGQPMAAPPDALTALHGFLDRMGTMGQQTGAFGPPVKVASGATELDRLVARTGRDPRWAPAV
ncbi:TIGR03086 family metal-binding protein [Micromonospora siamensis]|uniref:TIGR03086 family protein n=1 Tax=Micromonospora siamensis TaxID=299152 RepID=A0A1C5H1K9_9ACTN|nr:TIGR03086 family metal-binding protein [Micromonospora siamensis]SCG39890.1 TIGR03086 family protein [Micromonospora siamensis]